MFVGSSVGETKYLFYDIPQDKLVQEIIEELSHIDKEQLTELITALDGIEGLVLSYRKV